MSLERGQKFCTKCGSRLTCWAVHVKFDYKTGEQLFHVFGSCPKNKRWWDGHDYGWVEIWGRLLMGRVEADSYYHAG